MLKEGDTIFGDVVRNHKMKEWKSLFIIKITRFYFTPVNSRKDTHGDVETYLWKPSVNGMKVVVKIKNKQFPFFLTSSQGLI